MFLYFIYSNIDIIFAAQRTKQRSGEIPLKHCELDFFISTHAVN